MLRKTEMQIFIIKKIILTVKYAKLLNNDLNNDKKSISKGKQSLRKGAYGLCKWKL